MASKAVLTPEQIAFRHSRIHAEGWNAARTPTGGSSKAAGLNPYAAEPERSRWEEGFTKALA